MYESQENKSVDRDETDRASVVEEIDDYEDLEEIEVTSEDEEIEWLELERATMTKEVDSPSAPVLESEDVDAMRARWNAIQTTFVDEPHTSVEKADVLVAELVEHIIRMFSEKRAVLEEQWIDRDDVSTEDLRLALQRYRSFFNRLLNL